MKKALGYLLILAILAVSVWLSWIVNPDHPPITHLWVIPLAVLIASIVEAAVFAIAKILMRTHAKDRSTMLELGLVFIPSPENVGVSLLVVIGVILAVAWIIFMLAPNIWSKKEKEP